MCVGAAATAAVVVIVSRSIVVYGHPLIAFASSESGPTQTQGNYTQWLEHKRQRLDLERVKEAAQAKALQSELEWIRGRANQVRL